MKMVMQQQKNTTRRGLIGIVLVILTLLVIGMIAAYLGAHSGTGRGYDRIVEKPVSIERIV